MKDKKYIHQILHGDIHTTNQQMTGLETRDQAKTFIYALIYGAGAAKIGYIMNKSAKHGQATKNKFLQNVPASTILLQKVTITCEISALERDTRRFASSRGRETSRTADFSRIT